MKKHPRHPLKKIVECVDTYQYIPADHVDMLNVIPVYNEINLLPYHLRWCEANGLSLYVIDNYSKDGTLDWLTENKDRLFGFHQVDTQETFDLRIIQESIIQVVNDHKPTWFIYSSADLFYMTDGKLCDYLTSIKEHNAVSFRVINLNNTGEVWEKYDPFNTYFYGDVVQTATLIAMYKKGMTLFGDGLSVPNIKSILAPGAVFNLGFTKSAKERNETYERRQRAWKNGMRAKQGRHYTPAHARNWLWIKEELSDIRETRYAKYYEALREQTSE